jgi:hypothetical protein
LPAAPLSGLARYGGGLHRDEFLIYDKDYIEPRLQARFLLVSWGDSPHLL